MTISDINIDSPEKDILDFCKHEADCAPGYGHEMKLNYGLNLLSIKQQKNLLEEQNKFNEKILGNSNEIVNDSKKLSKYTRNLARATWALAAVTILIGVITTVYQVRDEQESLNATKQITSANFMIQFNDELRNTSNPYTAIINTIRNNNPIIQPKGQFSNIDIDSYLLEWETLANLIRNNLITEDMAYDAFSYDVEKTYCSSEIKQYIENARKESNFMLYDGFTGMAINFLAEDNNNPCKPDYQ